MIVRPDRGVEAKAIMTLQPHKSGRVVALLASGAILTQTSSCLYDTTTFVLESVVSTYLYDSLQIIFLNLLNV